tara:strand:- start:2328 stop:2807 length:480 start_codon:yes stop_codon:yes gene_type:complete
MSFAISMAKEAYENNEVPVGAVIVKDQKIIGSGSNSVIADCSVAGHAEINAIKAASLFLNNYRLVNCDMYVTLEPCHMCSKAIVDARIKNLFIGVLEPKSGAVVSVDNFLDAKFLNHTVIYRHGFLARESSSLLRSFFKSKRAKQKNSFNRNILNSIFL